MLTAFRISLFGLLVAGVLCAQSSPNSPGPTNTDSEDDELLAFIAALSQTTTNGAEASDQVSYSFRFAEIYDSNPLEGLKNFKADKITTFGGSVGLLKNWKHTTLTANYSAGADYYARFADHNQAYHYFNGAESFTYGRARLLIGVDYQRLPASSFGFAATHQISETYYTLINPDLVPSQSIQTPLLERTSHTEIVQLGLKLSGRSSIDISGSYARLRYAKNGIAGTNQAGAGLGYSLALSPRDSVGVAYQHAIFQTTHKPVQVMDSVILGSYAHRFNPNLVMRVGVGPDLRTYTGTKSKAFQGVDAAVAATAQLDYAIDRTHLNVGYWRSTVSGQGVLDGSDNDQIQLSALQALGHRFELSSTFGYARNVSLARVLQAKKRVAVDQVFNSEFFSASLRRQLASSLFIIFSYALQAQRASAQICVSRLCQDYPAHNVFTLGVSFAPKPVELKPRQRDEE
jgi:hypothetical protein